MIKYHRKGEGILTSSPRSAIIPTSPSRGLFPPPPAPPSSNILNISSRVCFLPPVSANNLSNSLIEHGGGCTVMEGVIRGYNAGVKSQKVYSDGVTLCWMVYSDNGC